MSPACGLRLHGEGHPVQRRRPQLPGGAPQISQLQDTIQEQAGTIQSQQDALAEREATILQQAATIDSQAEALAELEAEGTAGEVKEELQAAYTEGVESNG